MILISGATGRVGGAALRYLSDAGTPVRALSRDPLKLSAPSVEAVRGDLADRSSLTAAFEGVQRALLVTANSEQQLDNERNFIDAAAAARVEHVVKISSMEAGPDAQAPIPQLHYAAEQALVASGMDWTLLQPNFFMQNLLMFARSIAATDQFALPFGDARVAPIDCDDIGRAAGIVLEQGGHRGETYTLTGAGLVTFGELAAELSRACDRPIRYVDQPPDEFRRFLAALIPSEWHVNAICELFAEIKAGALEKTSGDVASLLGRPAREFAAFAIAYRGAFASVG